MTEEKEDKHFSFGSIEFAKSEKKRKRAERQSDRKGLEMVIEQMKSTAAVTHGSNGNEQLNNQMNLLTWPSLILLQWNLNICTENFQV